MGCCSSKTEQVVNELDLSNQGLKELPKMVYAKKFLRKLNMSSNAITTLDEKFKLLASLKYLDMSSNGMNSLSGALPLSLEVLIAKNNRLFYAPMNPHLLKLTSLRTLDLSQNQLE